MNYSIELDQLNDVLYRDSIEIIDYLTDQYYDQAFIYESMYNQFDLIFLESEISPKINQVLTYPLGYQSDGSIKKLKF